MIAVCRKELRSYRISMIGYVFIAFMLAVVSLYFAYQNLNLASPRFELVLQNVQFIFLVFVPILTMRVLAEEKKQKTDQLLLTLPMTVKDIVIGKYLAVVVLFTIPMLIICIYPLILTMFGSVNLPAAYFFNPWILSPRMCQYCNRSIFLIGHRKPGDLSGYDIRNSAGLLSDEHDRQNGSQYCNRICECIYGSDRSCDGPGL